MVDSLPLSPSLEAGKGGQLHWGKGGYMKLLQWGQMVRLPHIKAFSSPTCPPLVNKGIVCHNRMSVKERGYS